jgi:cytochrome c2
MKNIYLLAVTVLFLTSCTSSKKESKTTEVTVEEVVEIQNKKSEGLVLLQQKCYACHSVTTKSHDNIIAPPLVAVVRRYKMSYKSEAEFVEAVTNWVLDTTTEHALMRGAVNQFKVMPKQPFEKDEIIKIATYIFNNELETPEWFNAHFKEEHPNGMGKGQGKGKGMMNN